MGWQHAAVLAAISVCTAAPGCGPGGPNREMAKVSGKVTYQDKAVSTGQVIFQPASGAPGFSDLKADGSYELMTAIGPNDITIHSREPDQVVEGQAMPIRGKSHIPEKYSMPSTSGLKHDVKSGENTGVDFPLTD